MSYLQKGVTYARHVMLRRVARHDEVLQDPHQLWDQLRKGTQQEGKDSNVVCVWIL